MTDLGLYLRVFFALAAVLALIGVAAFLLRRFGADRFKVMRGKRRLSIVEVATIDTRRRLILVRRDAVEHLILIGGPNDVTIETGIAAGETLIDASDPDAQPESFIGRHVPVFTGKS